MTVRTLVLLRTVSIRPSNGVDLWLDPLPARSVSVIHIYSIGTSIMEYFCKPPFFLLFASNYIFQFDVWLW